MHFWRRCICTLFLSPSVGSGPTVGHLRLSQNKMTNARQIPGGGGGGHAWNWLSHKHLTLFVYVRKISKSLSNNKTISRNNVVLKPITKSKNTKWQSRLLVSIFGWKFADVFLMYINKVNKSVFTWLARLPRPISPWVHMRNFSPVSKMRKGRRSWGRVLERNLRNKAWRNAKL